MANAPARIHKTSDQLDAANRLDTRLHQLCCLTAILYGKVHTEFSADIKDGVLWLVNDLTDECKALAPMALWGEEAK